MIGKLSNRVTCLWDTRYKVNQLHIKRGWPYKNPKNGNGGGPFNTDVRVLSTQGKWELEWSIFRKWKDVTTFQKALGWLWIIRLYFVIKFIVFYQKNNRSCHTKTTNDDASTTQRRCTSSQLNKQNKTILQRFLMILRRISTVLQRFPAFLLRFSTILQRGPNGVGCLTKVLGKKSL